MANPESKLMVASYIDRILTRSQRKIEEYAGSLGDAWYVVKACGFEEVIMDSLRNRWVGFETMLTVRNHVERENILWKFAQGMHVTDSASEEFREVRRIRDLDLAAPSLSGILRLSGVDFTTGVRVFTTAVVDLSSLDIDQEGGGFGQIIAGQNLKRSEKWYNHGYRQGAPVVRLRHVIPAVSRWLDVRTPARV